jgi:hypothetical protein
MGDVALEEPGDSVADAGTDKDALRSRWCWYRPLRFLPSAAVHTEPTGAPAGTVTAPTPEDVALAQRCGSLRMNPRTRVRAGSGRAPPAYLLTTSTTCRIVCTTSRRTSVSVRIWAGEIGSACECEEGEGRGWSMVVKSRKIRICASICAAAYCPQKLISDSEK